MIRVSNLRIDVKKENEFENILKKELKIKDSKIEYKIVNKSIDARRKAKVYYVYTVDINTSKEKEILNDKSIKVNVSIPTDVKYNMPKYKNKAKLKKRPVIVGFGPAGMFAALLLAKAGMRPIVLERGKDIDLRDEDVRKLFKEGVLNEESNIQFGSGGAGAYSDGKLTTLIKDKKGRKDFVLKTLYKYGAPKDILYLNKPHIGTDNLKKIVKNIQKDIEKEGGEILYQAKFDNFYVKDDMLEKVVYNKENIINTNTLILALGHSARDTFNMLYENSIEIRQKTFAVGLRVEHPQKMIDRNQYGRYMDILPPGEYKLVSHPKGKRSVFSFCMCPGGYVVCASSQKGGVVTNGMSNYLRNSQNANSALLVNVGPKDFNGDHPLAGIEFQREIEKKAYREAKGGYFAPIQKMGDFMGIKEYRKEEFVKPTYRPNVTYTDLEKVLPEYVTDSIKEGIRFFDRKIKGFMNPNAILTGVETRSSSPVKLVRDINYQSNIKGIYPTGEGSGYSGGIMSSAIDAMKVAEKIIENSIQ